jgi:2-dehydropantoate 2-reductase
MAETPRLGILGAGAIGGYVGARLSAAGVPVTLVGRRGARLPAKPRSVDLSGRAHEAGGSLVVTDDPEALREVDACFLAVKSQHTGEAAETLAMVLRDGVPVVSLQNGLRNVPQLVTRLSQPIVPGMVTFNVRREEDGSFRRLTAGPVLVGHAAGDADRRLAGYVKALDRLGEPCAQRDDMEEILAAKLLLNLNNGLCALSGLAISDSLRSRELRRCFSACLREGLRVMEAGGRRVGRIGTLSPGFVARALVLPDFLFLRLARSLFAIDPDARSSTLQDLDRGRPTEIDFLNGEIVALAKDAGLDAPANRFVTEGVHALEAAGRPLRFRTPAEIRAGIEAVGSAAGR